MHGLPWIITHQPGVGEAAGPGAGLEPPLIETAARSRASAIDLIVGLVIRAALAVQFWTWARGNAAALSEPLDWRAWLQPQDGLVAAAQIWTLGRFDPEATAFVLLALASLAAIALALGFMTRLAGFLVLLGALWHVLFVLPEAWPSTAAYGAFGVYLVLRGAGPASIDWVLARLARLG